MVLGRSDVSSYPWERIKHYLYYNLMGREYGDSHIYYPTLKLQYLGVHRKVIPIVFRGARINPVSPFPEDRTYIILTSSEEDVMISHDLYNLVLDSSEEECGSTVTLHKI